jgi:preprotein translocase subunit SecE
MANRERNKRSARKARSAERAAVEAGTEPVSGGISKSTRDQLVKVQKAKAKEAKAPSFLTKISSYLSAVGSEMRRVVWPSRDELQNYSVSTIAMLVTAGLAIWLVDTGIILILTAFSGLRG